MGSETTGVRTPKKWDSILFFIAGFLMLANVAALWIRHHSYGELSILWAAVPGIFALAASIIGSFKLYPRVSSKAPWLARGGAGFALVAATALCITAIWIFSLAIFSGGVLEPIPQGIHALIGAFIISMVVAFIFYAVAFVVNSASNIIGYLLIVPVASWGLMLTVGVTRGLEAGLSLDLYTNGIIALAFLMIGFITAKSPV